MSIKEENFEIEVCQSLIKLGYSEFTNNFREDFREVINYKVLSNFLIENNNLNEEQLKKVILEIEKNTDFNFMVSNYNAYKMLTEGVKLFDEETKTTKTISLISKNPIDNKYNFIRQLEVSNGKNIRIPDITVYINGLPIAILELKNPTINDTEIINEAFKQNESLKTDFSQLWQFNVINFVSNRFESRYGTTNTAFDRMAKVLDLKTRESENIFEFLFESKNILEFIHIFTFFTFENNKWEKYIALPHQVYAVKNSINSIINSKDNKCGVVWHTQGSGKSVTMVMLAKAILQNIAKSTLIFVTDRKDLDNQLFQRFLHAKEYLREESVNIRSRADLIEKLEDKKHFGIYFAMIQKWNEDTNILSSRDDIILIADEAHRTQNNLNGESFIDKKKKIIDVKYGYAKFMRDSFPNAKLLGFTGTPLMDDTKYTTEIFGEYVHKYLMNDSVDDGSTVPIHYEMRRIELKIDGKIAYELDKIQDDYFDTLDIEDLNSDTKLNKLSETVKMQGILSNPTVIEAKLRDMLKHMSKRKTVLNGKSMLVVSSRKAAYQYYVSLEKLNKDLFDQTILVMTSSNKDTKEMVDAIIEKDRLLEVGNEFRKPNSKYKFAIVVDMWLTGFDVPDLDVLYVDKIMQWHNLMQAVARVNRTYIDKNNNDKVKHNGLIVDYIGIWKKLAEAMIRYSGLQKGFLDIEIEDLNNAKEKLLEFIDIMDKEYIKDINNYYSLNAQEKYNFIFNAYDQIKSTNQDNINMFILNAKYIRKFYKMAFSILNEEEIINSKGIISLLSLIANKSIYSDENLMSIIDKIKILSEQSIIIDESDIKIENTKITKNIYDLAKVLAEEAEHLTKTKPHIAFDLLKTSIEAKLLEMEKIRPFFAKKISDKLADLISELKLSGDIESILKIMKQISQEILEKEKEKLEFKEPGMQAFYEVLADDQYLKKQENSQILRQMAESVLKIIRKEGVDQIENNPRVKSKIRLALLKMLKDEYGYPPENSKGLSGLLINQLTKEVKRNIEFFKGK